MRAPGSKSCGSPQGFDYGSRRLPALPICYDSDPAVMQAQPTRRKHLIYMDFLVAGRDALPGPNRERNP
jgi:hypothetical protein